jgi:hypothetical protein
VGVSVSTLLLFFLYYIYSAFYIPLLVEGL